MHEIIHVASLMTNVFSINSINEVLCRFIMISHISQNILQLRKALLLNGSLSLFHPSQKHDFHDKLNYNYFPFSFRKDN